MVVHVHVQHGWVGGSSWGEVGNGSCRKQPAGSRGSGMRCAPHSCGVSCRRQLLSEQQKEAAEQAAEQAAELPTCRGAPVASSSAWCTAASTSSAAKKSHEQSQWHKMQCHDAPRTISMHVNRLGRCGGWDGAHLHAQRQRAQHGAMQPVACRMLLPWDCLSSEHNCNPCPLAKQRSSQGARWLLKAAAISAALSSPEPSTSSSANTWRAHASQRSL